jgi:hypothetical protein
MQAGMAGAGVVVHAAAYVDEHGALAASCGSRSPA